MKTVPVARKLSLGFKVGLVLLLAGGFWLIQTREPRYQGRTLTSWLEQYWDSSLMETQQLAEAQSAVCSMDAKQVVLKLVKLVESEDDPVSMWVIRTGDKFRISNQHGSRFIRWHSAEDYWWLGERGFEILGTNAAPAAEALGQLLDKKERLLVIRRCLESIGKPTEPVICRALTNRDVRVRQWAIDELAAVTDDVEVYVARIKPFLQDSSVAVRATTVDAIGIQTTAPELAVPLLTEALKDSSVSANAANGLANFGTNALVAISQLTNLVQSENENIASAALRTLSVIAPDEALPILTHCIARGKPKTDGALKVLADAVPDKALPLLLDGLQSSDLNRRRVSFRLLSKYPMTPKIESAMQAAAADSNPIISGGAKKILSDKYLADHPLESQFSDEPTYEGKPLGEWLKLYDRQGDYAYSKEATNAIHHIGTNAIPVLLERLVYVQPPFGLRVYELNTDAIRGFITLGDQALPALPELQKLMDGTNEDFALYAMISACGTGSNAIPILLKGLTNQFANVRGEAVNVFTSSDLAKQFPEQRAKAVPFFVELLHDQDENVRKSATNGLKEIDPRAAAQAGIK